MPTCDDLTGAPESVVSNALLPQNHSIILDDPACHRGTVAGALVYAFTVMSL